MNAPPFYFHQINDLENQRLPKTVTSMFFPEYRIFNNGHIEIVAPSPKNNNTNIFDSFLIIAKLLLVLCS